MASEASHTRKSTTFGLDSCRQPVECKSTFKISGRLFGSNPEQETGPSIVPFIGRRFSFLLVAPHPLHDAAHSHAGRPFGDP